MRRLIIISTLITFLSVCDLQAQAALETKEQTLAEEFLKRLNALDDWYLAVDGKEEGVDVLVNSMMELFAPDVLAEVPPLDPHQIGPVVLRGSTNIRKWIEKIARSRVRLAYLIKRQTAGPTGAYEGWRLVDSTPLPWGGTSLSFQIIATYSLREDRRRFTGPGAVFLQIGNDGKISRLRLLEAEISQVVPL